ncbi:MAG TPA: DNA methyltransferase, partial [Propionibacteriaceae bacterium]|nr:DNA methyltransferase [Propionibacteriaceae bacterium]
SVTDRVRRSHEDWVHLTKRPRYYAAIDEIREPYLGEWGGKPNGGGYYRTLPPGAKDANLPTALPHPLGKLPGSVWEIVTEPLMVPDGIAHARCCAGVKGPGCTEGLAHYAAFPTALPRRIIQGWSPQGICVECGEGRRPVAHRDRIDIRPGYAKTHNGQRDGIPQSGGTKWKTKGHTDVTVIGYSCACSEPTAPARPAIVLDPFAGTGTTMLAAKALGRIGVGVDRSGDYCRLAVWRTTDAGEMAKAMRVPKPPAELEGQESLFDALEVTG